MVVLDKLGIKKLYPSSEENQQEFDFPNLTSEFEGSILESNLNFDGTLISLSDPNTGVIDMWEAEPEDEGNLHLEMVSPNLSPDGLEVDCELDQSEAASQGYTQDPGEFLNTEFTAWWFVDSVEDEDGYIYMESRAGSENTEDLDSPCCQASAYGVRFYWGTSSDNAAKMVVYKKPWWRHVDELETISQTVIVPNFYQRWVGVKLVVYNQTVNNVEQVKIEVWLSNDQFQIFTNVYNAIDYLGRGWGEEGEECDGEEDQPLTWANIAGVFGYSGGDHIDFWGISIREIDRFGTFGEIPEEEPPPPEPGEEPEPICGPNQHLENGICVDDVITLPPDLPPPPTPTTVTKLLTVRREILSTANCSCDGIPDAGNPGGGPGSGGGDPGGGGGGGGGVNTLVSFYNVPLGSSFASLASVSNSSNFYLRFGQEISQTNCPWIGARIGRIEITIAEANDPRGGTGGGVHCRIRKGTDDSIAATLSPVATEDAILDAGVQFVFENLSNDYAMVFGDKVLFEYDGGDSSNYVRIFRIPDHPNDGSRIVWQNNQQDSGDYSSNGALDCCMRMFRIQPQVNPANTANNT